MKTERENLNRINSEITKNENAVSLAEQRIKSLNENITRYGIEKDEIEKQIARYNTSKSENEEKVGVLNDTINLMEISLREKKTALEDMEVRVKQSRDELKHLTAKHAEISKTLLQKRNEYEIT